MSLILIPILLSFLCVPRRGGNTVWSTELVPFTEWSGDRERVSELSPGPLWSLCRCNRCRSYIIRAFLYSLLQCSFLPDAHPRCYWGAVFNLLETSTFLGSLMRKPYSFWWTLKSHWFLLCYIHAVYLGKINNSSPCALNKNYCEPQNNIVQ